MILTAAILMATLAATPADAEKTASPTPAQTATATATTGAADQAAQADKEAKEKAKKEKKPAPPAVHEEMVVTATRYETDSFSTALEAYGVMSAFLYRKNVTKFDTRKEVQNDDIEGNNKSHGF